MNRRTTVVAILLSLACLVAAPAAAQVASVPRPGRGADARVTAGQVELEFENFALAQARSALGLADGQFFRFARAYRALQQVRRRGLRQRRVLMGELAGLVRGTGPVADPEAALAKIRAVDDHAVQLAQEVGSAHGAIDAVLNVRQRARFRQFEQQMERKKTELLLRAQVVRQ